MSAQSSEQKEILNNLIAIVVAASACMVTIFNIKDNNVVQAMSQAQAHSIDAWSYYQSKSTKQHLYETMKSNLELQMVLQEKMTTTQKNKLEKAIHDSEEKIAKYEKEKSEIKAQAEGFQAEYEQLNIHDDQFDMAEAMISLALAVLGITALTQRRSLFFFGLSMSVIGIIFGLAGFAGWNLHPEWLAKLLG